jgi:multiple sugar transport system permease protein
MVVTSFRQVGFTYDTTPYLTHFTLDNYVAAFSTNLGNHFGRALVNRLIISTITTVVALLVGVSASYALARLDFRAKFVVMGFILAASMFPVVALVTPLSLLFTNLSWIGTYQP